MAAFNQTLHIDLATLKGAWVEASAAKPAERAALLTETDSKAKHETSSSDIYAQVISTLYHRNNQAPEAKAAATASPDTPPLAATASPDAPPPLLHRRSDVEMVETLEFDNAEDHRLVEDSLMLAAAASCGKVISHILDGYSWGLVVRISTVRIDSIYGRVP